MIFIIIFEKYFKVTMNKRKLGYLGYLGFLGFFGILGIILYSTTGKDIYGGMIGLMGLFGFFGFFSYFSIKDKNNS